MRQNGAGEPPGTFCMHPGLQASPVKWDQGRLFVTCSDNGAITSSTLSIAEEFLLFAKTGLVPNGCLVREAGGQRGETSCAGPWSLLQGLSADCVPGALEATQMEKALW